MFARVVAAQGTAERFDDVAGIAQEQLTTATGQPGFQGFYLLVDRATGKLMTISLWETREHAEAVETRAAQVRANATPAAGVTGRPTVELYEVAVRR